MVKNKATVVVMAIISFLVMPYACNKGLTNLYRMWDTVENIKLSVMSVMPFNWSTYIADISIETVQQSFNWFLAGIRGLGFATMVYCVTRRDYGYGFIIAVLADGMSILNRIIYGYGWSFDKYDLIILAVPFAMWLICMIVGAIIKGKWQILIVAIAAMLTYWGIYLFVYGHMFFNVNLAILSSLTILSSLAMKQMDM
ncbi:hypothetical protein NHG23_02785 [Aerococcaceae bacterium NML190073]|nr:hypothetical protein [Aerococcaceae bacterium NML190073]